MMNIIIYVMSKLRNLLGNIIDDISNYNESLDVYFRETSRDLSVYSTPDENTDKVIFAMNEVKGLDVYSSDFNRTNGKTHFVKKPATFEATKQKASNIIIDRKSINIIHLNKIGEVI